MAARREKMITGRPRSRRARRVQPLIPESRARWGDGWYRLTNRGRPGALACRRSSAMSRAVRNAIGADIVVDATVDAAQDKQLTREHVTRVPGWPLTPLPRPNAGQVERFAEATDRSTSASSSDLARVSSGVPYLDEAAEPSSPADMKGYGSVRVVPAHTKSGHTDPRDHSQQHPHTTVEQRVQRERRAHMTAQWRGEQQLENDEQPLLVPSYRSDPAAASLRGRRFARRGGRAVPGSGRVRHGLGAEWRRRRCAPPRPRRYPAEQG